MRTNRVQRRKRRHSNAQAVIEMAMVFVILMAVITTFIGFMLEVQVSTNLTAATELATEAAYQVPSYDQNGTSLAPQARTATWDSFAGTMQFPSYVTTIPAGSCPAPYSCGGADPGFWCVGTWVGNGGSNLSVTCTAYTTINFNATPLGWLLDSWHPVVSSTATVHIPPERQ